MLAPWVADEVKTASLHDSRLNARLALVLSQLAARPTASIPAACGGRAEVVAAYRFCSNSKTSFANVLQPHRDATRQRMAAQPVVILPQDTTEINVTRPQQEVVGAGPLDGDTRRGALLHALYAFTPDGTPLGTVDALAWVREEEVVCKNLSRAERAAIPIEAKESHRWVATLQQAREEARLCPTTQFICVADSEADIYEVLVEATREPCGIDWIVRAARMTLRPPWRPDRKLPPVNVNVVLVSEVDPPPDDEPVEWLLLTNLPMDSVDQVRQIIEYYCVRWMIEVYFRVLKSGCRVEERLFEYMDRLLTCLAVYMIVAWRTLYVCRLGRSCPAISCEAVFEPAEWKSVWKVVRREDPPEGPPALGVFVRMVAQLGGYVNRKRDDLPGPQTVWLGLQRMHDFATCWQSFGPGAQIDS